MYDLPVSNGIKEIVDENETDRTIFLENRMVGAVPGQFVMVWIPGVDEKPFSLSYLDEESAITVRKKGKFTEEIFKLKRGDYLGTRGPYGNGFDIRKWKRPCIVAGGDGILPLAPLAEKISDMNPIIIVGATSKNKLVFKRRMDRIADVIYVTDDGSFGTRGLSTDALGKVIGDVDVILGCGPEMMLKRLFEMCNERNIECQLSLERYMRCGFGVCGSCTIGKFRVCRDGPVFTSKELAKMEDFGVAARLKTGKAVDLKDYYSWRE
ncbi:MAG: dihydroorotate dehydrogenase electron transfer subunit [Candidatus Micrarchaeales archaeon]|jgi:dihydroorotate dehydrogenase electron transfer subunit